MKINAAFISKIFNRAYKYIETEQLSCPNGIGTRVKASVVNTEVKLHCLCLALGWVTVGTHCDRASTGSRANTAWTCRNHHPIKSPMPVCWGEKKSFTIII